MAKKLIFTCVWMAAGFVAAAIIGLSVAPLVPRAGITQEHTPTAMTFISIGFALLPYIGIGIPLLLGLRGKRGTRMLNRAELFSLWKSVEYYRQQQRSSA